MRRPLAQALDAADGRHRLLVGHLGQRRVTTRTAYGGAIVVRGTDYDVGMLVFRRTLASAASLSSPLTKLVA
jgi:hypothetical protein